MLKLKKVFHTSLCLFYISSIFFSACCINVATSESINIIATVNGAPITDYDVMQREHLFIMQNLTGDLRKIAREDLINEKLKNIAIQEEGIFVSDDDVNEELSSIAPNHDPSSDQVLNDLKSMNINEEYLKNYLRSQLGWERFIGMKLSSQQASEVNTEQFVTKEGIRPSNKEFYLKRVIFVVPKKNPSYVLSLRKEEAKALRQSINGCNNLNKKTKRMHDVIVKDLGGILDMELPMYWKNDVLETPIGKSTLMKVTSYGVEFMVVCSSKEVKNDQAEKLSRSMNRKFSLKDVISLNRKYIKKLRDSSHIKYNHVN